MKNEITKTEKATQLVLSSALESQLAEVTTTGFENVKPEDLGLCILSVLQKLSPQVDKTTAEYVEGAEQGQIFNSVTKKSVSKMTVIPVGFSKNYVEWVPRTAGGGYVGRHTANAIPVLSAQKVGNKLITTNGNELVETAEHYVMVIPEDGVPYIALLPLKATQLKHSRRWLTEMMGKAVGDKRLPSFFQMYELSSGLEQNQHGSWYGLTNINYLGPVPDDLLSQAKAAADQFGDTAAKANAAYTHSSPQVEKDGAVDTVAEQMA